MTYDRQVSGHRLEAVRQTFYAARRASNVPTCTRSFEALLALFDDASLTMEVRAERAGISSASMDRLYDNHFRQLYGGKGPFERYRAYHKLDAKRDRKFLERLRALPCMEHFYSRAIEAGHSVAPALGSYSSARGREFRVLKTAILVSGRRCNVFPVTSARPTSNTGRRGRVLINTAMLDGIEAGIFPILVNERTNLHTLVIPTPNILAILSGRQAERPILHIPFGRGFEDSPQASTFDPHQYDNAWDLIPRAR